MPNPHRQEKLGELIAVELSDLLRTRVKDPRVDSQALRMSRLAATFVTQKFL